VDSYTVVIKNSCKPDLKKLKRSGLRGSFEGIVRTLKDDPFAPTQGFEKLQPMSEGRYSRRINLQHRVVYKVDEQKKVVEIYSAWSHYARGLR
jgi:Txe/YoeB family toxin of toxin-antitoxin system